MTSFTLQDLRDGLIVSCQAYPGEPMRHPDTMRRVAHSVVRGGAAAVRLEGLDDIRAAADLAVPIIGIWKDGVDGVFITPTLDHALAVSEAGASIVAVDGTRRRRPDGRTLAETIAELHRRGILVMSDCGSLADAIAADAAGTDLIGTTLSGYTGERGMTEGPDFELLTEAVGRCEAPVIMEGRVRDRDDVARGFELGAFAVCAGTAITHPAAITRKFLKATPRGDNRRPGTGDALRDGEG